MRELYHISPPKHHKKLGSIRRTTHPESTCPPACPFKDSGCFGKNYPCKMHWDMVSEGKRGVTFAEYCDEISRFPDGGMFRGCMVGDQPGEGDDIDVEMFTKMVLAARGKGGYTYTHKPVLMENTQEHKGHSVRSKTVNVNRVVINAANQCGFTVNLSANDLVHADKLAALGIAPVAVVVPAGTKKNHRTPEGRKVVMCPANGTNITCESCKLCADPNRKVIIGLEAHGSKAKDASKVANG